MTTHRRGRRVTSSPWLIATWLLERLRDCYTYFPLTLTPSSRCTSSAAPLGAGPSPD